MIAYFEKLYKGKPEPFYDILKSHINRQEKVLLVTANPEVFSKAQEQEELHRLLLDDEVMISPDGEGVVKAARMLGFDIWGKIAGVDTVSKMLAYCNEQKKSLYCFGSKQEVLDALKIRLEQTYPNLKIAGMKNGYDYAEDDVFQDMAEKQPDLILVALGVPKQELAVYRHMEMFSKGVFIGVGGSLDVLSGFKKRAPEWLIRCKLEWLYRLIKEPSRIKKFYRTHVLFLLHIRKMKSKH